ncbi:MAG: class I SAM-dependent RNA methyltransferase [Candidatus Kapabacteria bacterium]|nr:class I SAM-dependent RNA methyltransferase [Candidatus Kapabacteria bacterium]
MTHPILITCPREIPQILAREVEALGLTVSNILPAAVETSGTLEDCMRLNLWLRTAHRVLLRLGAWSVTTADEMYEAVKGLAWHEWIPADGYLSVVSSIDTPEIDNTMYANMRCKDAIVDQIRERKGIRPSSGPDTSQSVVFLYWHDDSLMVYVDTSGQPLSDRGYRMHPAKAPMRESLAAAVILSMRWSAGFPFVNPMCGSGTLGIEAAMIAANIAPGSIRQNMGLFHLLPFEPKGWQTMRSEARQARRDERTEIRCSDIDPRVVRQARENARAAGVSIDVATSDFRDVQRVDSAASSDGVGPVIIFNPEYGLRLGDEHTLRGVYRDIGDLFKQRFGGYTGYVFTGNMALAKEIGLRSSRRMTFWSADLECRLLEFELYAGTRKAYGQTTSTRTTDEHPTSSAQESS